MSSVIYKTIGGHPVWASGGSGVWLEDDEGRRYLDACGGVAVSSLGHRHPRIIEAVERSARDLAWAHAGTFTSRPAEELAELLACWSGGLTHAQFLSSGSEAMELALKIAYQYHAERGDTGRKLVISRRQSYHGSTLATLAISGNLQRRSIFEPLLGPAEFVAPCYAYRDRLPGESTEEYAARLADGLEARIRQVGVRNVAAFTAETVVGSTNGAVPAVPGYLSRVKEVCARHGVLLVLDEVMAGLGRTGRHFAYLDDGVVPDIVAVGKGLGAGYVPISAVLVSPHIHRTLEAGSGVLQSAQTNVNHSFACAVALEVQRTIHDDDLLGNVKKRGEQLRHSLTERFSTTPVVGDIRGRGLFIGVELVDAADGRTPMSGGAQLVSALKRTGMEHGVLLYPGYGTVDGKIGNHVLLAPPFIAESSDIEEMVARLGEVIDATFIQPLKPTDE